MQRVTPSSHRAGFAYLAGCVAVYGTAWPVLRIGSHITQPAWFATARLGIACVTMLIVLSVMGRLKLPTREDWPAIFTVGACMMGFYAILMQIGLLYVGAGRGAVLGYTTPLWVTPVAVFVRGERMTPLKAAGLALGLAGLAVLFNPLDFDWSDRNAVMGNVLCLAAAFSWSIAILHMRVHKFRLSPVELSPWQLMLAAAICAVGFLVLEGRQTFEWSLDVVLALSYAGPIASGAALFLSTTAMRLLPSMTVSIWLLGVPLLSLTISVTFLGEKLTASLLGGLALIIAGLAAMTIAEARRR